MCIRLYFIVFRRELGRRMEISMKEFFVFTGNFGSGKSELAINLALQKVQENPPCTLVDMDTINPYFRSAERGDVLKSAGVRVIAPPYALHKIEIMSVSAEVYSVFAQKDGTVIFDAGGDPVGAIPLGQYFPYFKDIPKEQLHVFMVINPFRPLAETADKAHALMEQIQMATRLAVTDIINNANLVEETTLEDLLTGYHVVKELSEKTGLPVHATTGTQKLLGEFAAYAKEHGLDPKYIGQLIPIDVIMHRTWNKFLKHGL